MPTLNLHHYKNQKQPYVAKIVSDGAGKTSQSFLPKVLVKKSDDGTYGDYQSTVNEEGFYRIGNTKPKDGGYRLFFTTPTGEQRSGLCNGYEICRALHSYLEWWLLEYQVCRVCAVAD